MIAGMLAAYVSTISTQLNWGTSYLVHDLYRRFIRTGADERHYVMVGRLTTALLMLLAGLLTFTLESARVTFDLLLSVGAGTGLLYLLRWFWWRINAWSEVSAMASSFVIALAFFIARKAGAQIPSHWSLLATVAITSLVWISVTLATRPTDRATLLSFYRLARPAGPGWKPIAREAGGGASPDSLPQCLLGWVLGCCFVYAALFGAGSFIYGKTAQGAFWAVLFAISGIGLLRLLPQMWATPQDA
jgi:SSS family solute:Na+ symporter